MLDFYSGFEGEPEIRFELRRVDEEVTGVRIWDGYFYSIMAEIHPEEGRWTGLALPYHLCELDDEPWKIPNLQEVTDQWERTPVRHLDPTVQRVHAAVLALLRTALASGGEVWIIDD